MVVNQETLQPLLDGFTPIGLGQMDSVELLNRIDRKYVVTIDKLPELLAKLSDDYFVLEINDHRSFGYNTIYFDTHDLQFYRDHHNGLGNRVKVRCREYTETSVAFFEIKRKYMGTRTDKYRHSITNLDFRPDAKAYQKVRDRYKKNPFGELHVTLLNSFRRITLVSKTMTERCTIDFDLEFESAEGKVADLKRVVIVEVKQSKATLSPVVRVLKEQHIYPCSVSKYAFGMLMTNPALKRNAFKPLIHRLNKITSAENLAA